MHMQDCLKEEGHDGIEVELTGVSVVLLAGGEVWGR